MLRKRRGKTQDDLAQILGMKRSTLSGYENDIAQPGMEALIKISSYFRISIDTLIKIDLTRLTQNQLYQLENGQDVYITGENLRVLATTIDKENEENIEIVSEKAKAGYADGYADPEYISELPVFQLPFLSNSKKYRTFQLNGDSMYPIPDKSWVTGEYVQDWNNIMTGEAYIIFSHNDGIVFKIIENKLNTEGKLILYSLNPLYEPFEIHVKDIREVWKFVHYISSEIPDPVMNDRDLIKTVASLKQEMEMIRRNIPGINNSRDTRKQ